MLAGGAAIKVVSQMLGHKDIKITLDRYGHVLPTMQEHAVLVMDALLTGKKLR
jgi:integrase